MTQARAERFLQSIREDDPSTAQLLGDDPQIARVNVFTAAAAGNINVVADLILRDPACAVAVHGREE